MQKQREINRAQLVLDILDVWIPSFNLGLVNLNDGIVGLLGLTTSVLAFNAHWTNVLGKKQ